jgi:hypothetical protein
MNRVTLRQHSPAGRPDLLGRHADRRLACSTAVTGEVTESGASGGDLLLPGSLLVHGRENRPHKPPPRRRGRARRLRSPGGGSRSVGADRQSRTARLTTKGWVECWTAARLTVLLEPGRLGGCGGGGGDRGELGGDRGKRCGVEADTSRAVGLRERERIPNMR